MSPCPKVSFVNNFFLTFILMNLNCLVNKVNFVFDLASSLRIGLFCLCETWLNSDISNAVVSLPGYNFFRNDSPSDMRIHGVGLYVRDDIKVGSLFVSILTLLGCFCQILE